MPKGGWRGQGWATVNWFLLRCLDGTAFFAGVALAIVGTVSVRVGDGRLRRSVAGVARALGLAGVVASATPLPWWAYAAWGTSWVASVMLLRRGCETARRTRARRLAVGVFAVVSVLLVVAEVPYRLLPRLEVERGTNVFVVGDSLSAGLGDEFALWPEVLAGETGFAVHNLARAGATLREGLQQVDGITTPGSVVIFELGGNDLLGDTNARAFRGELDACLAALHRAGHRVVMLELPLFPLCNGYGRAQRMAAARYGAALVPKRVLVGVLGGRDNLLDGLHLSAAGHRALGEAMAKVLQVSR